MKSKNSKQEKRLSPAMVEDRATERLKKRAQDLGLIVNTGAGMSKKPKSKKEGGK